MPLFSQASRLCLGSAGKLFVQASVITDDSPVRRHLLSPVAQVFLGGFGGDADENAGSQRAGGVYFIVAREPRANFGDRDELSPSRFSDERVNIQRLGYEHRTVAQPLGHTGWDINDL
jgi:hypothetical protein